MSPQGSKAGHGQKLSVVVAVDVSRGGTQKGYFQCGGSANPFPHPTLVSPDNGPGRRSPFFHSLEEAAFALARLKRGNDEQIEIAGQWLGRQGFTAVAGQSGRSEAPPPDVRRQA